MVRPAVDMSNRAAFPRDSFHLAAPPGQMPMDRMDPSMVIAFYVRDRADLQDWCERVHVVRRGRKHASQSRETTAMDDG